MLPVAETGWLCTARIPQNKLAIVESPPAQLHMGLGKQYYQGYPEIHPVTSKVYQAEGVRCLPHTESYIVIAASCTAGLIQGYTNRLRYSSTMGDAPAVLFAPTSADKVGSLETGCWWVNHYTLCPTQMSNVCVLVALTGRYACPTAEIRCKRPSRHAGWRSLLRPTRSSRARYEELWPFQ